jgi:hypothetical protein
MSAGDAVGGTAVAGIAVAGAVAGAAVGVVVPQALSSMLSATMMDKKSVVRLWMASFPRWRPVSSLGIGRLFYGQREINLALS